MPLHVCLVASQASDWEGILTTSICKISLPKPRIQDDTHCQRLVTCTLQSGSSETSGSSYIIHWANAATLANGLFFADPSAKICRILISSRGKTKIWKVGRFSASLSWFHVGQMNLLSLSLSALFKSATNFEDWHGFLYSLCPADQMVELWSFWSVQAIDLRYVKIWITFWASLAAAKLRYSQV